MRDNDHLDKEGGVFATVENVALLDGLYTGYKEGSGQVRAYAKGTEALMSARKQRVCSRTCLYTSFLASQCVGKETSNV